MTMPGISLDPRVEKFITTQIRTLAEALNDNGLTNRVAVLSGTGAPSDSTDGNNGDWYIRTSTGAFYHKAAGSWAVVVTITITVA